ncbi:sensor histidine kinase [Streptomyces cathayae]|uniref:sensor histidine kinase n=1 Tax=Streptomyces cathayae TaxID=3031124 RepID=UPI00311ADACF
MIRGAAGSDAGSGAGAGAAGVLRAGGPVRRVYAARCGRPPAPAVDLAAYRIVQEALTNVRKHAGADHARLCLHYRPQWLTVTVEDDGCARPDRPPSGTGHGLIGMRERAASVGGKLEAAARPGGGSP